MTDQDPEDPLPGLFAEIDQMLALAPQIARIARVYYVAFQAEGFTDEQADRLPGSPETWSSAAIGGSPG